MTINKHDRDMITKYLEERLKGLSDLNNETIKDYETFLGFKIAIKLIKDFIKDLEDRTPVVEQTTDLYLYDI